MKIYLVGGAVRDKLLGKNPKDLDYVVTGSSEYEMLELGYTQVGADFPVFLHPETKDEYALARIERKNGNGYNGFACDFNKNVKLEDDLSRRDLTINSMAMDSNGVLYDPFNGKKDLENKILRHTTEAFKEDPLRILRICRFAARYVDFEIHEDTKDLMREMIKNGEIDHLTKERVWKELEKVLVEEKPSRFFNYMNEVGGLVKILPDIYNMIGVPQREDYHAEGDVFVHTMLVIDESAKLTKDLTKEEKIEINAATLFHDIGKTKTKKELLYNEDGSIKGSHNGHDDIEIVKPMMEKIKKDLKMPNNVFKICLDTALIHQNVHSIKLISEKGLIRMFNKYKLKNKGGENYIKKLMIACHADSMGRYLNIDGKLKKASKKYIQKELFLKYYKEYEKVIVSDWIEDYKVKKEEFPRPDLIQSELHRRRINALKKIVKKKNVKKI